MKEELVTQFLARYPFQFAEDRWFWQKELVNLLDEFAAGLALQKCANCGETVKMVSLENICPVCMSES